MYAWGNNAMGQCGQGHTSTPVTKPKKVIGLEGVSIQQITAGTSHSLAWTAVPTDRYEGGPQGLVHLENKYLLDKFKWLPPCFTVFSSSGAS